MSPNLVSTAHVEHIDLLKNCYNLRQDFAPWSWLVGWLVDGSVARSVYSLVGWSVGRLVGCSVKQPGTFFQIRHSHSCATR